jgi:glycosyltransferase involved in cell wall biosynthesis
MKIHILYPFKEGPWGGANQFLKAIKAYLEKKGCYENNPKKADIILFNGSPSALLLLIKGLYKLKKYNPTLLMFVRLDGPIFLIRDNDLEIDKAFYDLNNAAADGMIFQSDWSKEKNFSQGMCKNIFESTIINAPNPNVFNTNNKKPFDYNQKIRLIATSWSSNFKKGFATYKWLDENLDFSRYEMSFVGNSPINFKNIHNIPPLDTNELAKALKNSDIFITASQKDPCSNSLIEALHCGLLAIVLKDGGHPELLGKGGEIFTKAEEIPDLLDKIVADYLNYQNNILLPSLEQVGEAYYKFMENVFIKTQQGEYIPKKFSWFDYFKIKKTLVWWRSKQRIISLKGRIGLK